MNEQEKKRLVPVLRFPEFRDKEEWEERTLSDVLSEHRQKSTGEEDVFSVSVNRGLINQIEHLGRSFSASSTDHYNRVLPGDIVYTKSPTGDFPLGIIKQSRLDFPVIVSPLYGVFSPETVALGTMLDAYFESPINVKVYLEPLVQKGAKNTININNTKFLSGALALPLNKNEQQKIADCLTSIDELITAQTLKLDAFKTHKKGLMQQLFPAEGETVPKLRFPEFWGKGEWEYIVLDPFLRGYTERVPSTTELPIYSSTRTGLRFQKDYYDNRELENEGEYGLVPSGYFVYRHMSDDGTFKFNINKTGGTIAVSKEYPVFTTVGLHSDFLLHLLNEGERFKVFALAQKKGGTRTRLYLKVLRSWKALLPSYPEQQKIADCLTPIDELIVSQSQKVEALKAHKKGLMQQLFPAMDEAEA